jgi:hypothetical protein
MAQPGLSVVSALQDLALAETPETRSEQLFEPVLEAVGATSTT